MTQSHLLPISIPINEYICKLKPTEMSVVEKTNAAIRKLTGLFS